MNSASYEYRNISAKRGEQLVSIGMLNNVTIFLIKLPSTFYLAKDY